MSNQIRKTPLSEEHLKSGAKMVDFAGWWMPVQYKGLKEEHLCVRNNVGLFDVSHMGEIRVKGPKALETLEWLTTNQVSKLEEGQAQYSLLPNEDGGLVDDIYIYCLKKNSDYLVCVNAANDDKDWAWFQKHNKGAELIHESNYWAQVAVQGPKAPNLIDQVLGFSFSGLKRNQLWHDKFRNFEVIAASTGYTGEKGGEIFIEAAGAIELWQELLHKGADLGIQPIGLGARDTLRTEMKYSLYGHEIDDMINPYSAGLGWVIKAQQKDFLGKSKILAEKEKGLANTLVGIRMLEKAIPRQGYELFGEDGEKVGKIVSGTLSPVLEYGIGIAFVAVPRASVGAQILVDIRGRKWKAEICPTPFVVANS